jgi:cyclase
MAKMSIFTGERMQFLPKITYKEKLSLLSGKDRIDLYYFGAGHTNGDAWVVFPALRVMHAADMFARKDAPLYDRRNGGSGVAFPLTLSKALAGIKDIDTIITGHSSMMTWSDLEEHQRFNRDLLAAVREAMKAGKSADEASASLILAEKYQGYQAQLQSPEGRRHVKAAVEAIYEELKR